MIIPTPEFDPLFANDGVPFRDKMLDYILREFADLLASPGVVMEPADELNAPSGYPTGAATRLGSPSKRAA